MKLSDKELREINGGISAWAVAGLIGLGIFLIGMVDGFIRPLSCNE